MLFIHLAGRLTTPYRLAFQDSSRFSGTVSCVPRARKMPRTTVSTGATKIAFPIGCAVRVTFANTKRLLERIGSASEMRSEIVWP